ncbi:hypothetical protein [Streptomyces mobaraensis]|uniref:SWIM-type domain-containing protein n=1 Tax=Streptomyces mobaraensis TaxID=35621 RepID=A0A5N5W106_STRMB|nr:hypothetical protein [Streptomyces mobaraensis]KAB7835486.1 hypothetical protein FRZ00_26675 [Streptomyces mobaraensis]
MTNPNTRNMSPLVAAWKQNFHLATGGSGAYIKGLNLQRKGAVGQIHATPGRLSAAVGAQKATHKAVLAVLELTDAQWHTLVDRLADIPQAVADLLANRVPAAIADPGHARGTAIVPGAEEISFTCSCPTGHAGRVCEHSAALGHAVTERLASAASVLLAARGMPTRTLAALLRDRLATTDATPGTLPAAADGTVRADQLYSLWANRPPQQAAPECDLDPIDQITATLNDPPAPCPSARGLAWMTQDAADRAHALLNGTAAAGQPHDPLADAIRILATPEGVRRLPDVARATGHTESTLRTMMIGYRHGGPAGAHAAHAPTPTPTTTLEQAAEAIRTSRLLALGSIDIIDGTLTDTTAGIQLRPGPDGAWFPFTTSFNGEWRPAAGSSADPAVAYQAARRARTARPAAR